MLENIEMPARQLLDGVIGRPRLFRLDALPVLRMGGSSN